MAEFYQGITIEIKKVGSSWIVLLDGKQDASFETKGAAKRYVQTCIKTK